MNPQNNPLSDEQMSDLLAARGASVDAELGDLRAALDSYRTETLVWAERRSATQPSLAPAARRSRIWAAVPQWSLAAVAAVSIAVGVAHFTGADDRNRETEVVTASTPAAEGVSADDLAEDNQLLSSINQALSYREVSPVDEFNLKPAQPDSAKRATGVSETN